MNRFFVLANTPPLFKMSIPHGFDVWHEPLKNWKGHQENPNQDQ